MPLGPYKDFASCVSAQKKKGQDDESAKKICGAMEQRIKEAHEKGDKEFISFIENLKDNEGESKEMYQWTTKAANFSSDTEGDYLEGILSSNSIDRGNDRISKQLISKWAMAEKKIPLLSVHANHWKEQVGIITDKRALGDSDALYIRAKLLKSTKTAQEFREYLKELKELGQGVGLSVGVANPVRADVSENGLDFTEIKAGELVEGSVVPIGMNQDAFGFLAKQFNLEGGIKMPEEAKIESKQELAEDLKAKEAELKKAAEDAAKVEVEKKEAGLQDKLEKALADIEELKKKSETLTEKKIDEVVMKALGSLKTEKKSEAVTTEKDSQESILTRKLFKEE